jgi:hypothetical protein
LRARRHCTSDFRTGFPALLAAFEPKIIAPKRPSVKARRVEKRHARMGGRHGGANAERPIGYAGGRGDPG